LIGKIVVVDLANALIDILSNQDRAIIGENAKKNRRKYVFMVQCRQGNT
jgi:hypothetical protein